VRCLAKVCVVESKESVKQGGGPCCGGGWVDPMGVFIEVSIEKVLGGRLAGSRSGRGWRVFEGQRSQH
jgi:hypothetical protein